MEIQIIGIHFEPEVKKGDNLTEIFLDALKKADLSLKDKDIIVFTSKIISKSQGRVLDLSEVRVTKKAVELADKTKKDKRVVQLILNESNEIIRVGCDFIITEVKQGFVCANAGIDESNVAEEKAVLLPDSLQRSANSLRREIERKTEKKVAVLISDSIGRAFRDGIVGTCIGVSGLAPVFDRRGELDRFGKVASITKVAIADEVCAASNLVMGEFREGVPIALVRGLKFDETEAADSKDLVFSKKDDVFR